MPDHLILDLGISEGFRRKLDIGLGEAFAGMITTLFRAHAPYVIVIPRQPPQSRSKIRRRLFRDFLEELMTMPKCSW